MSISGLCSYCGKEEAVASCDVCGSNICAEHNKDYGCAVCGGGQKTF